MAHLVNQQQIGIDILSHSLVQGLFIDSGIKIIDQFTTCSITGLVSSLAGHQGKALCQVRFTCSASAKEKDGFISFDEPQ